MESMLSPVILCIIQTGMKKKSRLQCSRMSIAIKHIIILQFFAVMALVTLFDDLSDLALIELFSYLSSVDVLWAFARLNDRLTSLVAERGFFRHVNLSSARRRQFDTLLRLLPLKHIESLVIDSYASPLQLSRWPCLPRLTTLQLKVKCDPDDVLSFVLLHAASLTHIIFESNKQFQADGHSMHVDHPKGDFGALVKNILALPALQLLDLGTNYYGLDWNITAVPTSLTYLRVVLGHLDPLFRVMLTRPLGETLRQLHVTLGNNWFKSHHTLPAIELLPQMVHLHTFTFAETFFSRSKVEWTVVEILTAPSVMPVLRRANVAICITDGRFDTICQSPLFTDHRCVDVHFALSIIDGSQDVELSQYMPRGSRYHPRQVVGATLTVSSFAITPEGVSDVDPYSGGPQCRHYLWYTLPWAFSDLFQFFRPDRCITQMQVFASPPTTTTVIGPSRLRILDASGNVFPPPILFLPHVVPLERIDKLHLSFCNSFIRINLPSLRHVTLLNSLNVLNNVSLFPATVQSIHIVLKYGNPNFMDQKWAALHSLSTLPRLSLLNIVLYDMDMTLDNTSCQMIAEAAPLLTNFGICFRRLFSSNGYNIISVFNDHAMFIEQLLRRILSLLDQQPDYIVEQEGCGLKMWF